MKEKRRPTLNSANKTFKMYDKYNLGVYNTLFSYTSKFTYDFSSPNFHHSGSYHGLPLKN